MTQPADNDSLEVMVAAAELVDEPQGDGHARCFMGRGFSGSPRTVGQANPLHTLISMGLVGHRLGRPKMAHLHPNKWHIEDKNVP
jgi:hypothetical protein